MNDFTFSGQEPIAIVGMGCRMPGKVRNPSDLWELLMSKGTGKTEKVPKSRFNIDAYLHPDNERPGSFNVPGGFFLEDDPGEFEPSMFKISPVEAACMDPQQRKLLEVVFEAFENSGSSLDDISGKRLGCFVGCFSMDYQFMMMKEPDFRHLYAGSGSDTGILPNRVSHIFNLKGPSVTINTACSSSLYALDLACKAISSGECEGAIVGGTNLILAVDQHMNTAKLGALSSNSQSRPFDDSSDGYGRGEGVGALYLKPLRTAIRDGDPVRSVIRSTTSSHNGYNKDGITRPDIDGQTSLISLAYQLANLRPEDTSYIECHGTGTQVGDPIEIEAIQRTMGNIRPNDDPILVGSVKGNVGHSEAASSIATIIKATLILENGIIPPTAAHTNPASSIPWDNINVQVVTEPTPLPTRSSVARVGINAFGYGGTNSHAILESVQTTFPKYSGHKREHKPDAIVCATPDTKEEHLLLFSAHNRQSLKKNISRILACIPRYDLIDLAYTLGVRRTKYEHRTFAVVNDGTLMSDMDGALTITSAKAEKTIVGFVFTGQGAQWPLMGSTLLKMYPSVLQTIQRLDRCLSMLNNPPSWTIGQILTSLDVSSLVNEPEYAQPLCTAVQIALVNLMDRWGIEPAATIGHSSGEIAAAYAAGYISEETAIITGYLRGKTAASMPAHGAMLSVGLSAKDAADLINKVKSCQSRVIVACHNAPRNSTLSGDMEAVEKLKEAADRQGVFTRLLRTCGKAYHSHHTKDVSATYHSWLQNAAALEKTLPQRKKVPMFSTVHPQQLHYTPPSYWVSNLNNPVLFNEGVQELLSKMPELNTIIEIGPHSALRGPLREICQATNRSQISYLPTLKRYENDIQQMLHLAGNLWAQGANLNIETITSVEKLGKDGVVETQRGDLLVDLPTYSWVYPKSTLSEGRASKEHRGMGESRHDILGRRVIGASPLEPLWRNILRQKDLPWLAQHRVAGEVMLPAAAYLCLAMEAIEQVNSSSLNPLKIHSYTMRDVVISTATVVPDDDSGTETIFRLQPMNSNSDISPDGKRSQWYEFSTSCFLYGSWKESAKGRIALNVKKQGVDCQPQVLPDTPNRHLHLDWLRKYRELGLELGPAFHHIEHLYMDGKTNIIRGDIGISRNCGLMTSESRYVLHPTVIDACLQPSGAMICKEVFNHLNCSLVPTQFEEVTVFPPSDEMLAERCVVQQWSDGLGKRIHPINVQLISHDGSLLVDFVESRSVEYRAAVPQEIAGNLQQDLYMQLKWNVDFEYLAWAKETGYFKERAMVKILNMILHKESRTRVICLDGNLSLDDLVAQPGHQITLVETSQENSKHGTDSVGRNMLRAIDMENLFHTHHKPEERYDVVIDSYEFARSRLRQLREIMSIGGTLLLSHNNCESIDYYTSILRLAGFSGVDLCLGENLLVATVLDPNPPTNGHRAYPREIVLVYRTSPSSFHALLSDRLQEAGWKVRSQDIESTEEVSGSQVILLADSGSPLLFSLEERQLKGLINLTETASSIIWVTSGGLIQGDKPEYGMSVGLARTIRNEKASLDLVSVDFDLETTTEQRVSDLVLKIADRQREKGRNGETEYRLQNGMVFIGRITPQRALHRRFVPDSGEMQTVYQSEHPLLRAKVKNGNILYHRIDEQTRDLLDPDHVEVHVAAIGLSAPDSADDSAFLNHELVGSVVRVGANVKHLGPGTIVSGFALENLSTFQRTHSSLVHQVPEGCSLTDAATMPSSYVTAIYGLTELARSQPGEKVVIVDGMGSVGQAAVKLCEAIGAVPTVIIPPALAELHSQVNEAALPSTILLRPGDSLNGLSQMLAGDRGIDVLFYPASADLGVVTECSRMVKPLGRIVALGYIPGERSMFPDFSTGSRSLSFFQYDLPSILKHRPAIVASMLKKCWDLYNEGKIEALRPIILKRPTDVNHAIHSIPSNMSSGKCVITYDKTTKFDVLPSPPSLKFKDDVSYLLVGCLGGLGRRVALWMANRGARHLVFVSRSGTDSKASKETVESLESSGVIVSVLRADITNRNELFQALAKINTKFPVRGVLNAANVLHDGMFNNISIGAWRKVVNTKVIGSLNLHELLRDEPLDFFVMTSSIAATLGSSGQANYSAANSMLDSLAQHRHSLGLPAVSLILPAIFGIGLISENVDLEKAIQIKGMYGIQESEMLEAFEIAMRPQSALPTGTDHIIIGMQPRRLGPAVHAAGANLLSEANLQLNWISAEVESRAGSGLAPMNSGIQSTQATMAMIRCGEDEAEIIESLVSHLIRRLGRLLMVEEELISPTEKSVAGHGLDSMIGTEYRNWIFREFKTNIPFQQLLAGSLTIFELARTIYQSARQSTI